MLILHRRYQLTFCRRTYLDNAPAGATQIGIPAETDTGSMPKSISEMYVYLAPRNLVGSRGVGPSGQHCAVWTWVKKEQELGCGTVLVDIMQPEDSPK